MVKKNNNIKFQKRDLVIIALVLAIAGTNWVWYQSYKLQDTSNRNDASSWLQQQVQINTLKHCIDNNIKPCVFPSAH